MTSELEITYKRDQGKLLGYIKSKIRNSEDAEDLLQDVFFQAVKNIDAGEPIENVLGWLFRITNNKIIDWYRSRRRKNVSIDSFEEFQPEILIDELITDVGIEFENEELMNDITDIITESINELPEDQRWVIMKQSIEGKTFKELSEESGIPINTLISRKRYAIQFLRNRIMVLKDVLLNN